LRNQGTVLTVAVGYSTITGEFLTRVFRWFGSPNQDLHPRFPTLAAPFRGTHVEVSSEVISAYSRICVRRDILGITDE
jgi:hypothetical protein